MKLIKLLKDYQKNRQNKYARAAGFTDADALKDAIARQLQSQGIPFYTDNVPLKPKGGQDG